MTIARLSCLELRVSVTEGTGRASAQHAYGGIDWILDPLAINVNVCLSSSTRSIAVHPTRHSNPVVSLLPRRTGATSSALAHAIRMMGLGRPSGRIVQRFRHCQAFRPAHPVSTITLLRRRQC